MQTTFRFPVSMHLLRSICGIISAVALSLTGHGQVLEKDAVTVKVTGKIIWEPGGEFYPPEVSFGGDQILDYQHEQVSLAPGRDYHCGVTSLAQNSQNAVLQIEPPAGYRVYLDDIRRNRIPLTSETVNIRVEHEESVPTGQASSLRPGRIVWTVGLGNVMGGRPADAIGVRAPSLTASTYKPEALVYDNASPEVWRAWDSHGLRQVYTTSCLVDITTDNDYCFRLKFYPRNTGQIGSLSGGVYSLTGDPIYEYVIENPDGSSLTGKLRITRITRQGGATQEMWTEMRTGGSYTSVVDWVEKPANATSVTGPVLKTTTSGVYHPDQYTNIPYELNTFGDLGVNAFPEKRYYYGGELSKQSSGAQDAVSRTFSYDSDGKVIATTEGSFGTVYTQYYTSTYAGDGSYSDFDRSGQIYRVFKPFGSTAANPANASVGEVTTYDYAADWTGQKNLPSSIVTTVNGVETARTAISYAYESGTNLLVATRNDYSDTSHYLATVTKTFREDVTDYYLARKVHSVKRPDGTMAVTLFYPGTFSTTTREFTPSSTDTELLVITVNGTSIADSSSAALSSLTLGSMSRDTESDFRVVPNASTANVIVQSADGNVVSTQSWICTGTTSSLAWQVVQRDVNHYNGFHLERTSRDSGNASVTWDVLTNSWTKGRIDYSIDENGTRTDFTYDSVNQILTKTRIGATSGNATLGDLMTIYGYDVAGRVVSEVVSGGPENLITLKPYDDAGRLASETAPGYATAGTSTASAVTTSYTYDPTNRKITTTLPSGATKIEEKYLDGRLKSRTGTGVVAEYYTYGVESDGSGYTRVNLATDTNARKRETWTDRLGRTAKTSRPGFTGQAANEEISSYNTATGQLSGRTPTGLASTLFGYNSLGQATRSGLDADANSVLQTNSASDRINDASEVFEYTDSAWWRTKTETTYFTPSSATATTTAVTRTRLTGLTATLRAETRTTDAEGNETRVTVTVDATNKLITTTTKRPGMASDQVDKALNGLPIESTGHDGLTIKKRYDALGRLVGEIEPRTGSESNYSTKYSYHPNTAWVKEVKDAANKRLSFSHYDAASRVIYTEDALAKTTRTLYTARGEVDKVWGTATYPVSYVYNTYGERTNLRTYRDPNNAAATDTTTFPSVGSYDETTWEFDVPSGLLKKKTDAKGKFVEYTYNVRGQTYERFWSRTLPNSTTRVKATFAYYGDATGEPKTGELKSITYNDGTPTVSYAYTRGAQTDTVTDATGTHDFVYDSSQPWRLATEALDSFYGSRALSRAYESATSTSAGTLASHTLATVQGRTSGLKLGTTSAPASELEFSYPISSTGRVAGVTSARGSGAASRTFTYGYETNSALLKSLALTGSHPFTITREFETSRDLITSVEAKWSTTSRTKYAYTYDDRRQRTSVMQSGDVFNDYGGADSGAIHQIFTYNARGEVTAAPTYLGATATDQSQPLSARFHEFDYDGIGNRKWSNTSGNSSLRDNYTANELNQYTAKENHTLAVGGTVADDANIKVAAGATATQLAGRHGRHWGDNIVVDNSLTASQGDLTIYAVNPTTNKKMTDVRTAFLPPASQTMQYDQDGNLTNDGVWSYQWDAENRLIAMQTTSSAVAGGVPAQRLEFKYDYLHRRIEKLVRGGWNGSVFTTVTAQKRFLYDGWSLIAEFSVSPSSVLSLLRSYTWGLDIAKSLTDAGGVGALLQIHDYAGSGKDYLPSYDGNGNIAALFDADASSSGTACVAAYEYSPYGESLRCEGPYAKENPFRFSTKFTDDETGLVYYGRRYYSPSQGRFLGRDPSEEVGGLNLYGFCRNNSGNRWDYLGMRDDDQDADADLPVPNPSDNIFDFARRSGELIMAKITRDPYEQLKSDLANRLENNLNDVVVFEGIDAHAQFDQVANFKSAIRDLIANGGIQGLVVAEKLLNSTTPITVVFGPNEHPAAGRTTITLNGSSRDFLDEGTRAIYAAADGRPGNQTTTWTAAEVLAHELAHTTLFGNTTNDGAIFDMIENPMRAGQNMSPRNWHQGDSRDPTNGETLQQMRQQNDYSTDRASIQAVFDSFYQRYGMPKR